jgi:hypothetical protein
MDRRWHSMGGNIDRRPEPCPTGGPAGRSTRRERAFQNWSIALVVAVAVMGAACDSNGSGDKAVPESQAGGAPDAGGSAYRPEIDPDNFVAEIDNPLFPLKPGTVYRLRGETEDEVEHETITVLDRTKEVMGVTTTVVKDAVSVKGEFVEFTYDWYAQDRDGNVWYFGENTAEYEDGKVVSREGSWEAGVDGALPGIIMNADPQVTDSFRQEYFQGEAEDMYWVVETGGSIKVPYGSFDNVVHVLEWNPLEPKIVGEKYYAPGVGLVWERALSGGKEIFELLDVKQP